MNDDSESFRRIADFAPVGIAVIDASGSARYVNRRFAEITHRAPDSLLGQDLNSILAPDDRAPALEVALRWLTADDDRRAGAVAIVDDITGQVMERSGLARMAAGIAHEFDHTLTGMLTAHGDLAPDAPAATSFDVNDLIRATVPPIVEQETAVTLSLRLAEPATSVHMDPTQLAEALRFLTVNAVEAMPRGGEITVVASRARTRPAALPDGEFAHISVVDNGCGMPAESLEHAVEPFFTTKAGTPRAGLGLATAYGIVNRAGGRMSIDSAPGAGTTVHMYLPSPASVRHSPPPADDGDSRPALLIVDDNRDLRTLATRLLSHAGFEVLTASGGVEALAILRNRSFDCLVTDIAMPDMGGIDLAESVRTVDPELPVVFVSGFVNIPRGPGGPLPDDAHSLTKPYTAEALTAAVRRAMRARSPKAAHAFRPMTG